MRRIQMKVVKRNSQNKKYFNKQQAKARKRELIPQLQEAYERVKTARTPDEFYSWQEKVEYLAVELRKCESI